MALSPGRIEDPALRSVLEEVRTRTSPVSLAGGQLLAVVPGLAALIPEGGLRRGSTVVVSGARSPVAGVTSLGLALIAAATAGGSWCAAVGLTGLGVVAAGELGVELSRLALVPDPGTERQQVGVIAALLDAMDLVLVAPSTPVRPADARRLAARVRERRSVLVVVDRGGKAAGRWPGPCDLSCAPVSVTWAGLGRGTGLLSSREVEVEVRGRGAATRPRRGVLALPQPAHPSLDPHG